MNSESVQVTVPAERSHGSAALEEAVRLNTVIFDKGKTWLADDLFPTLLNMSSGGRRFFSEVAGTSSRNNGALLGSLIRVRPDARSHLTDFCGTYTNT
jgi:hypothetical protein